MRKVIQKDEYGCGAACLAMLTGMTYKKAVRSIYGQDEVDYTSTTEIRLALEKYGITLSKKRQPFIPGKTKNGLYRAISESKISLPYDAIIGTRPWANGNWHWVIWDSKRQKILDPYFNNKMPKLYSHYLKVSA